MKILYFTDPHIRASSPGSRLDDFPETIMKKIEWVGSYAKDNDIEIIIVGGDWLDRPDVPYSILSNLATMLLNWRRNGITVYTVLGNHDLYGYNPKTFSRTGLSVLCVYDSLKRLSEVPIIIGNISLTGVDAHYSLDKDGDVSHYVNVDGDSDYLKIHVVHGFLDKEKWDQVPSTAIKDILHTGADIVLTGHEHKGYGVIKKGGKLFCNPGALARVTAGLGDINQEVSVAVIDSDLREIELAKLPIDIAKPASEVLDREKLLKEKDHTAKMMAFSNTISEFQTGESLNLYALLDNIAKEEKASMKAVDISRTKLQEAEEEIAQT